MAQLLQNNLLSEMFMLEKELEKINPDYSRREFILSPTSIFFMKILIEES